MPIKSIASGGRDASGESASALQALRCFWRPREQPQRRARLHLATRFPALYRAPPPAEAGGPESDRRSSCGTYLDPFQVCTSHPLPQTPPPPNDLPVCRGPGCRAERGCPDRRHQRRVGRARCTAPGGHCGTPMMARARPRDDGGKPLDALSLSGQRASFQFGARGSAWTLAYVRRRSPPSRRRFCA